MNRIALRVVAVLALLGLGSVWLFGQAETGSITGTIRDASGAVVVGAKIEAKSVSTGYTRETGTNSAGIFTISTLRPDTYAVTIDAANFQKSTQRVQVTVGAVSEISTTLKVGSTATTVEVTGGGEAPAVNTENAEMSTAISSKEVEELPTLTRNPYDLVGTSSNVNPDSNSMRGAGYSINGLRSASTEILLDGGQNVDTFSATVGQTVPLDSVQEFSVLTNNFGAEYGRASGGVVNVVTKSGTNQFHGTAYEYNRVSALSSNTYFNNANDLPKSGFTRNQFGFSVGGPIIKSKLFFFENAEWIRVRSNAIQTQDIVDPSFIPLTSAATQQFFSTYGKLGPVQNLATISWGAATGGQCPAGIACSTTFADKVAYLVPADAGGGYPQNTWMNVFRVDYNLSDKTTMFGRYAAYNELDFPGTGSSSPYVGYNTGSTSFDQNITYSISHVFTPNLIDTFKVIYNRLNGVQGLGSAPVGPTLYTTGGVPPLANTGVPLIFPGYVNTGPGTAIPFGGPQNLYQVYDDLAWTKGRHQFKFGGDYIQIRDNRTFGAYYNAVEDLGTAVTCVPGNTKCAPGLANLVKGNIYQYQGAIYPQGEFPCVKNINTGALIQTPQCTLQLPVGPPSFARNYRYNDGAVYAQDNWKLTSRLTLNLGLRWEYYGVQHNAPNENLDSNFVLGPGSTIFQQIRNGQVKTAPNGGVFWNPNYNNWGPRIGFAYDVLGDGTTSVRGGFGIGYERNFGNVTYNAIQNPPNYGTISLTAGVANSDLPSMPIFTNNAGPLSGTGQKAFLQVSQRAINQNLPTAYAETWNFGIQRQMTKSSVVAVEYAGSHGVHLYSIANINPQTGGGTYLGDSNFGNRLNLQYTNMNYRGADAYSNYNALNVRWTSNNLANLGLDFNAVYTWSHSLDNLSSTFTDLYGATTSGYYALGYTDAFNPSLDYGNSDYDIRNRFVLSGVWNLPWMKNSGNAFERYVLGGWAVGTTFFAHTGIPYSIYDSTNAITADPRWIPGGLVNPKGGELANLGGTSSTTWLCQLIPLAQSVTWVALSMCLTALGSITPVATTASIRSLAPKAVCQCPGATSSRDRDTGL